MSFYEGFEPIVRHFYSRENRKREKISPQMQDLIIINALYVYMKLAFFSKGKNNLINVNDSLFDTILSFKKIEISNQLDFVISKDTYFDEFKKQLLLVNLDSYNKMLLSFIKKVTDILNVMAFSVSYFSLTSTICIEQCIYYLGQKRVELSAGEAFILIVLCTYLGP